MAQLPPALAALVAEITEVVARLPPDVAARVTGAALLVEGPGAYWVLGDVSALPELVQAQVRRLPTPPAEPPCPKCGGHPADR